MLFMNDRALQSLLSDKFKLGADASVAAGSAERHAATGTDIMYGIYAESFRGEDHPRSILEEAPTMVSNALATAPEPKEKS